MPRSRRLTRAARVIGTSAAAAALSVAAAQTALACSIGDFSAAPACDSAGKPVIRVTDKDGSGTPATVTLLVQLNTPGQQRNTDTQKIDHPTAQGVGVDLHPLDWYAGETFVVHVKAGDRVDEDLQPAVVVPDDFTCEPAGSPSPSVSATPSAHPSSTPSAVPSPAASGSAAPTPAASSAPSPAGGGTRLAETGASSDTPVLAGAAVALVVVGGGLVVALRRRSAQRSR
ncbi:LAETG motif-containing sortase-dependent surface protein [Streptomyces sp. MMG1121]|uniref:LAETG motif-containing sortase-dependent surface protein n=1 Tax=Streptomyces sp. MMG1121 TaxID=1415544 RepID=UPI0006ADF5B0|nr:LAETG motif-containing sortase-dependent surface protein [Streptomyces sp. MMG1121]